MLLFDFGGDEGGGVSGLGCGRDFAAEVGNILCAPWSTLTF